MRVFAQSVLTATRILGFYFFAFKKQTLRFYNFRIQMLVDSLCRFLKTHNKLFFFEEYTFLLILLSIKTIEIFWHFNKRRIISKNIIFWKQLYYRIFYICYCIIYLYTIKINIYYKNRFVYSTYAYLYF